MKQLILRVLWISALALPSCAGPDDLDRGYAEAPPEPEPSSEVDESTSQTSSDIVGGTVNWTSSAIGRFYYYNGRNWGSCTATLIARNAIVTAAHCAGYRTQAITPGRGLFDIYNLRGQIAARIQVTSFISFGTALGARDVAVARLASNVTPGTGGILYRLARAFPARGTTTAVWGFGCNNDSTQTGSGVKRVRYVRYGYPLHAICPGDSGGPMAVGLNIVQVNSSFYVGMPAGYADSGGHVVPIAASIEAVVRQWGGRVGAY